MNNKTKPNMRTIPCMDEFGIKDPDIKIREVVGRPDMRNVTANCQSYTIDPVTRDLRKCHCCITSMMFDVSKSHSTPVTIVNCPRCKAAYIIKLEHNSESKEVAVICKTRGISIRIANALDRDRELFASIKSD